MGSSSNYPKGVSAAEEALPLFQQVGDESATVEVLINLAYGASYSGNSERARAAAEEGVAKARVLCDQRVLARALRSLAEVLERDGDLALAGAAITEALIIARTIGARIAITEALDGLPFLAAGSGNMRAAARLLGATASLRERLSAPIYPLRRPLREQAEAAVQTALGEATFITEFRAGGASPLEEAMDEALVMCRPLMANPVVGV